jgi:hypothetical protein
MEVAVLPEGTAKYRFALIRSFSLPAATGHPTAKQGTKQERLPNYEDVAPVLDGVEWDLIPGPVARYGDWAVENREEFCLVGADRLAIVRQACESGKYNAIVLLGGGEPGAAACREIAHRHGIPVSSAAFAQMHVASMLGRRFSVLDLAESHSMHWYDLVIQHEFTGRCASTSPIGTGTSTRRNARRCAAISPRRSRPPWARRSPRSRKTAPTSSCSAAPACTGCGRS